MKKILLFISIVLFSGCGISDDCVRNSGALKNRPVPVTAFENIYVFPGISLVVSQGPEYEVSVKAGENFIDDIEVKVANNALTLKDNSGCNWVRDYGQTTVYVTAPNLVEIYSNTEKTIRSNGVLTFPMLRLYSMDFFGGVGTGDFIMEVNNSQLVIASNHVAGFYITGQTQQMLLNFYDGIGRFEGADFLANDIVIFQRGSNDMIVHPVQSISGNIYSTGNVISKTHPATVNVVEHYSGRLLFD